MMPLPRTEARGSRHDDVARDSYCAAVRETPADVEWLDQLLRESESHAGQHLRTIFGGANRLSATELVAKLDGVFEMHLAVLSGDGAPLVAPIDGIFVHGKVFFSVASTAVRSNLLRRDPRVSTSYADGSFGLIVHGTAVETSDESEIGQELFDVARELYVGMYGAAYWDAVQEQRQRDPREGDYSGWIEPRVMFAKR